MVVIYDSVLTEPPSSVHCFRDVTLYVNVFLKSENILRCPKGTRSMYWKWIKSYGAHDFISELITESELQEGISVGREKFLNYNYINEVNYNEIIEVLKKILIF